MVEKKNVKQDTKPTKYDRECHQKFKLQACIFYLESVRSHTVAPLASPALLTTDFGFFSHNDGLHEDKCSQSVSFETLIFPIRQGGKIPL